MGLIVGDDEGIDVGTFEGAVVGEVVGNAVGLHVKLFLEQHVCLHRCEAGVEAHTIPGNSPSIVLHAFSSRTSESRPHGTQLVGDHDGSAEGIDVGMRVGYAVVGELVLGAEVGNADAHDPILAAQMRQRNTIIWNFLRLPS